MGDRVVEMPRPVFEQFRLRAATEPNFMQRARIAVWIAWRGRRA